MKPTIDEKAEQMIRNNKIQVECIGSLNDRVFYLVGSGENKVQVCMIGSEVINCTCKHSSVNGLDGDCSYTLAVKKFRRKK